MGDNGNGCDGSTARRASQFEAVFEDDDAFRWVLDADGSLRRANRAARSFLDADRESLADEPFWELPWWTNEPDTCRRLRAAVERAGSGERTSFTVDHTGVLGESVTLEFTIRPVRSDGEVDGFLVEGNDVTHEVSLERELRASEELHRVTLNNMTDTVLITDDEGRFTYVCPNVHFIFGYTAEEIHEMGTIDELLGPDLYDPADLAESGVLTNVECEAEDNAGDARSLLVNVREVDIQGGTILYSCRDVTKRKQRERALHALHGTAEALLLAGTRDAIARIAVDDAADVLGVPAVAAYLFDTDENVLRPVATSAAMRRLYGTLPAFDPDDDGLPARAFVEGETATFGDAADGDAGSGLRRTPTADLRSGICVPLGDHGVLVAASTDDGAFDEVTGELAELLGATAEAALDRVVRESELRERDRALQAQNRRLADLNRINEVIRGIDQALVRAETREDVEQAVADRLADDERIAFAWVGGVEAVSGGVSPRAWAGDEGGYLDAIAWSGDEEDRAEPTTRAIRDGGVVEVANVAADLRAAPWRREALSRGFQSVVAVPLAYDGVTYGVLTVYADRPSAFDETALEVLNELGDTVAYAIAAVERRGSLLHDGGIQLSFDVSDRNSVLYRLARDAGCDLVLDGIVPGSDGRVTIFLTATGAAVEDVRTALNGSVAVEDYAHLGETETGERFQVRLAGPFVGTTLADHGAVLRSYAVEDGEATAVVVTSSSVEVRAVAEVLKNAYPSARLLAKREGGSRREGAGSRDGLLGLLTERQREVVQSAYHGGYFESPRDRSGEDLAALLDISPQAFHQHLRTVQRKLFAALFDEPAGGFVVDI